MSNRRTTVRTLVFGPRGSVLVLRRSLNDDSNPGKVDFPGGGVDPGETVTFAAVREVEEEAGIHLSEQDISLVYTFTVYEKSSDTVVTRLLYISHVTSATVHLSHEHDAFWWHSMDEVVSLFSETSWYEALWFVREHNLAIG